MTPTQAQIEAAAKAIYDFDKRNSRASKDFQPVFYGMIAKAALIAAARVGWNEDPILSVHGAQCIAATIERCAQVAIEVGWTEESEEIAAAIRALRDKP